MMDFKTVQMHCGVFPLISNETKAGNISISKNRAMHLMLSSMKPFDCVCFPSENGLELKKGHLPDTLEQDAGLAPVNLQAPFTENARSVEHLHNSVLTQAQRFGGVPALLLGQEHQGPGLSWKLFLGKESWC